MRVINTASFPDMQATLFYWNDKYIVKFETPQLEQTYKVKKIDAGSEEDILSLIQNEDFLSKVRKQFQTMQTQWDEVIF